MLIQLNTDNHIDGRDPVVRQVVTDLEQSRSSRSIGLQVGASRVAAANCSAECPMTTPSCEQCRERVAARVGHCGRFAFPQAAALTRSRYRFPSAAGAAARPLAPASTSSVSR